MAPSLNQADKFLQLNGFSTEVRRDKNSNMKMLYAKKGGVSIEMWIGSLHGHFAVRDKANNQTNWTNYKPEDFFKVYGRH